MEHLWATWRMAYIREAIEGVEAPDECIFCHLPKRDADAAAFIVARGKTTFALLNAYPYNSGHLMVAPYRHVGEIEDLTGDESSELLAMTQRGAVALKKAYAPDGLNLGMNLGRIAGAGFPGHLHMHLVPRWSGDTNFMTVVGDVTVVPESLEETYSRVVVGFEEAAD